MSYEDIKNTEVTKSTKSTESTADVVKKATEMFKSVSNTKSDNQPDDKEPDNNQDNVFEIVGHEVHSKNKSIDDIYVSVEKTITSDSNMQYMIYIRQGSDVKVGPYRAGEIKNATIDLANSGVILGEDKAECLKYLIVYAIAISKDTKKHPDFPIYKHTEIGWKTLSNGSQVYLGNRAVGLKHDSQYVGKEVACNGSLENWVEGVNQFIAPKIVPSIVMASSVSGIIRQKIDSLCEDTQLVLGLIGNTSVGKTTLTRAAHSVFCSPMSINDYNCTANAMQEQLAKGGPKVNAVDDIMRMKEIQKANPDNLIDLIFQFVTGKGRTRCNSDGSTREAKEYFGSVIISANDSILGKTVGHDVGQSRRLIELPVALGDIADSSESNRQMSNVFNLNYGHAADAFAEKLLAVEEDEVIRVYTEYLTEYETMNYMQQLSKRYAMISLCADLSNRFLGTQYDLESIKNYLKEKAEEVHELFYGADKVEINSLTVAKTLSDYFCKHSQYFQYKFFKEGELKEGLKETLGTCNVYNNELILRIPSSEAEEINRDDITPYILMNIEPDVILDEDGFGRPNCPENYEDVLRSLRKRGILKCGADASRLMKKVKLETNGSQYYVREFHLKLDANIMGAIKSSRGYTEKVDHKDQVDHENDKVA